jgi:hypothetical protein
MTHRQFLLFRSRALVTFTAAVALLTPSSPSNAADSTLAAPLCGILKKLLPEVRGFKPEGARAQLVMAVAEKFNYDAGKLRQVKAEIDAATTAGCPKEREGMLGVVKTKTLAEAVS